MDGGIFDAISSWWVVTHGHRYPPIMAGDQGADRAARPDHLLRAHSPAGGGAGGGGSSRSRRRAEHVFFPTVIDPRSKSR